MNYDEKALTIKNRFEIKTTVPLNSLEDLSIVYTPGVAAPCREIAKDPEKAYEYTSKNNLVAVVTDGSAVLGLGNIGGLAGMPVMEGKCVLFKELGDVNAIPICLSTQDPHEIIKTVKAIAPTFGGINLEDIKAPECFQVEEALSKELDIPVFHDDQHGTAIVVLAGLLNAVKLVKKELPAVKIVIAGAGAAGLAITNLLLAAGAKDIILVDSRGIIPSDYNGDNSYKKAIAQLINPRDLKGTLEVGLQGADIFIGVAKAGLVSQEMISSMATDAIVFSLANPDPEIMPDEAKAAGAAIVATGRSDFPNQINNALVFPGLFRGLLDARIKHVTTDIKLTAARALASSIEATPEYILPSVLDKNAPKVVADAVKQAGK